jgi:hypothetical protein
METAPSSKAKAPSRAQTIRAGKPAQFGFGIGIIGVCGAGFRTLCHRNVDWILVLAFILWCGLSVYFMSLLSGLETQ